MRKVLATVVAISIFTSAAHGFAQSETYQKEAERELREIDCAVLTFSQDLEIFQNEMRATIAEMSTLIEQTNGAQKDALEQSVGMIGSVTKDITSIAKDFKGALTAIARGKSKKAISAAVSAATKFPMALKTTVKNIQLARKINKTVLAQLETNALRNDLIRAGNRLDEASTRAAAAESVISTLIRSRETVQAKWAQKGVNASEFYGDECIATKFDGVWQTEYRKLGMQGKEDVVEVRGTTFYFDSGTSGVTEACGRFEGKLDFSNDTTASTTVTHSCGGLNVYMNFAFSLEGDELMMNHCQVFSSDRSSCDLPELSEHQWPINLVKIAD